MSTISVNIPEPIMSAIAGRARSSGYADVGEFVSQYIMRIADRQAVVEGLAIEGLLSGPSEPWNSQEIDAIRHKLKSKQSR